MSAEQGRGEDSFGFGDDGGAVGGVVEGESEEAVAGFDGEAKAEVEIVGEVDGVGLGEDAADDVEHFAGGGVGVAGGAADGSGCGVGSSEGDGAEVGVAVEVFGEGVDDGGEKGGGVGGEGEHQAAGQGLLEGFHMAQRDGVDDGLLVREEAVEGADRDLGLAGDLGGGEEVDRQAAGEEAGGGGQDFLHGFLTAALDRGASRRRRGGG